MKKSFLIPFIGTLLFLVLLPLVLKINFPQNDEWVYYDMVTRFMQGDFTLHWYTGPTFYTQGIMAAVFGLIFGVTRLPVLTLIISVLNFIIFSLYINKVLNKNVIQSILLGLLMFFNPIYMYLGLGFMTGQYFLFFLLLALWSINYLENKQSYKAFILLSVVVFLGLLVRQVSLFIPLALTLYFGYKRNVKLALWSFILFLGLYLYYSYIFPLTPRIKEVPLEFKNLIDFKYSFALIYGSLIVLTAQLLPIFLGSFNLRDIVNTSTKKKVIAITTVILLGIVAYFSFYPDAISWAEYPYFENTVERTGFYPRGVDGTKYQFRMNYDLYKYWDLAGKVIILSFITYIIYFKKKEFDLYFFLALVYFGMLVLTHTHYDRYLVILVPLVILYLVKNYLIESKYTYTILSGFILFLTFLMYQFSTDFVIVNNYIWNRSNTLANENNIDKSQILSTRAWNKTYQLQSELTPYLYKFSYDSPEVNEDLATNYELIEIFEVKYPGSIWIKPNIYLYKKII